MADILKLKAEEKNNLTFEVYIQGSTEPVTEIRFTLVGDDSMKSYPCVVNEKNVTVNINDLTGDELFENFKLEIFINNKYFSPVEGQLQIEKALKVTSSSMKVENSEPEITIESKNKVSPGGIVVTSSPIISDERKKEIKSEVADIFHEGCKKKKKVEEEDEIEIEGDRDDAKKKKVVKEKKDPAVIDKVKGLFK